MTRTWAAALACAAPAAIALAASITPFFTGPPGPGLPAGWRELRAPRAPPPSYARVEEDGVRALRVRSEGAAGAALNPLRAQLEASPVLAWRWKIDRVVEKADMSVKAGDDFAARVYVFFEIPDEDLPWGTRVVMKLARLLHGEELPAAALCYVWDNRHRPGTSMWNPYTDRVRMVVVESGDARAGRWVEARRDLEADFRAAFGAEWKKPVPPITGIAVGNDTDQTGESATAWFADLRLEPR